MTTTAPAPAGLKEYRLIIGGKDVPAADGQTFDTVSPTTNRPIGRVAKAGAILAG